MQDIIDGRAVPDVEVFAADLESFCPPTTTMPALFPSISRTTPLA
jgi:hypothetical protein